MKYLVTFIAICLTANTYAQQTPLPHGMVYGIKPDTSIVLDASKLESFMGRKNRVSTVIKGRVSEVKNENSGWILIEAGSGKLISARFKNSGINLPRELKGRIVIIQGVANLKLDAVNGKPTGRTSASVKDTETTTAGTTSLVFEVTGLMVYQ